MMSHELLENLDQLHTTELGAVRVKRNLSLDTDDVVGWCKMKTSSPDAVIKRKGKNWYVTAEGCTITINAYRFTIITAHREKMKDKLPCCSREEKLMTQDAEKMGEFIDKQECSFVASISEEGFPNMKAMLPPRKRVGIREFYFTTNTSSMRAAQYRKNPNASIYFCDKRSFRGVMLVGHMEVLEDSASKEMIWKEGDIIYYPGGVTDPDYCVLKFVAESGRYYANFHSKSFEVGEVE